MQLQSQRAGSWHFGFCVPRQVRLPINSEHYTQLSRQENRARCPRSRRHSNRQARRKLRVMIWADPGCSLLPLTTGNWSITKQGGRTMGSWLSEREQRLVAGAEAASAATPVPTQIVSNGEYFPPSQSAIQKKVEARINELADLNGKSLGRYKFQNYMKEIYYDSDTTMALLSGAPFDDPSWWLLSNEQIAKAREMVNDFAGSRRLLAHSVITPKQPGWMDEVDKAIAVYKPDSWKAYTIGDPLSPSKFPWRLDDEQMMYPFYEKSVKAGINTICIHKGLLPPDYEKSFAGVWEYATVWDVGKAAKNWPQLNFVIYHSALRPFLELPDQAWNEFETTGRIRWATDLAEIPQKFGVTNVHAELGTSFANSAVAHPKFCAALVGTLIKGMGADHVLWGTDSVWYGSPQWQIEALRRLEIPEDMQKKYGFAPLGDANSATKQQIFSGNAARMYNITVKKAENTRMPAFSEDRFAALKKEYTLAAREPSNLRYGYVRAD